MGNGVLAVPGQSIHTGSDEEMGAGLTRQAEQFVDIAASITNMDASFRMSKPLRRLAHVLEPAEAFLSVNRNACGIDLFGQSPGILEFLSGSELDGGKTEGQTVFSQCKARMHK